MDDKRSTEPKFRDEDLQDAVDRIQIFWEKYGNQVMIFVTVLFLSLFLYKFFTNRSATQHEDAWASLAGTSAPLSYNNLANDTSNPTVRIMAFLRSGDLYLAEGSTPPIGEITQEDRDQSLKDASAAYESVIKLTKEPIWISNAKLGLASIAESQANWSAAKGYYDETITIAEAASLPAIKKQAELRITLLPEIESPIKFAPEAELPKFTPEATTPEAAAPGSIPATEITPALPAAPATEPAAVPTENQ
ncbi:hypothetical protein KS4_15900 [Poriferisphaera corsica]|uniref:Tetratricopeptide repeat-like domain-containing protein n=1 Tax=Poriferisphaera corsica TaxID=2528020 RepID=A0A517YTI1_9BACT|nr:hypothetical protein [Poriferisphaera corsica]QDU33540.1 hypothetical protein KS4_15900 [Poriferisphaera corsica]